MRYKLYMDGQVRKGNSLICYEELLWQAYQKAHGKIAEYYFSMDQRAAAVLIKPGEGDRKGRKGRTMDNLDFFYPIEDLSHLTPDLETTLWTCVSQFQTIRELDFELKGQEAIFYELFLIVIYLFVVVESQQGSRHGGRRQVLDRVRHILGSIRSPTRRLPAQRSLNAHDVGGPSLSGAGPQVYRRAMEDLGNQRINDAIKEADSHLKKLAKRIDQFAERQVQRIYLDGMFLGSLCVLAVVAVYMVSIFKVASNHNWTSENEMSWYLIAIAATSGTLGAVVSVMLRFGTQPSSVDSHAGRQLIRRAGGFRPIVGSVFGLVFYLLINAGLLQALAPPADIGNRAHYVAAICFVAGFSERRAQDVIVRAVPTGGGAETAGDKSPARRPEEGSAP